MVPLKAIGEICLKKFQKEYMGGSYFLGGWKDRNGKKGLDGTNPSLTLTL